MSAIRKGSGYADDTNFDEYDVIAEPLPAREDRVFTGQCGRAVTYDAYSIRLGRHKSGGERGGYAIIVNHGGGSELVSLATIHDDDETINQILILPERALYVLLWTLWNTARQADEISRHFTRVDWSKAYLDNRIRKSRVSRAGTRKVWIEPAQPPPSAGSLL